MRLLTTNAKLSKAPDGTRCLVAGLALAPHTIGGTHTVCANSTAGCRSACNLWFAGRTVTAVVRQAMEARKAFLLRDPVGFHDQLNREIRVHIRRAKRLGLRPLVRLNVASDLDWSTTIALHSDCTFYDYSKVVSRAQSNNLPANYEVTYSRSERSSADEMRKILAAGRNIAAVFNVDYQPAQHRFGNLPAAYLGAPVVDGDQHDFRLREIDGEGVIVGLRLKGGTKARANAIRTGFAVTPE